MTLSVVKIKRRHKLLQSVMTEQEWDMYTGALNGFATTTVFHQTVILYPPARETEAFPSSHDILKRKHMIGKIIMVIGILGVLLGGAVLLISLLLPLITDGRTSWDEALLGIIPGAIVLAVSFVIFAGGLIIVLVQRKKKQLRPSER